MGKWSDTSETNIAETIASFKTYVVILSINVAEVEVNLAGLVIRGNK